MSKIILAGIGMGSRDSLTVGALNALQRCGCLIGAPRLLECFEDLEVPKISLIASADIARFIEENPQFAPFGVVLSGDIGFYSGAKRLLELLAGHETERFPGITTVQYLCAKLGTPWEDVHLVSLHGKDGNALGHVLNHPRTLFLLDNQHTPAALCRTLCDAGLGDARVSVGCRLSYPDEAILSDSAAALALREFPPLCAALIEHTPSLPCFVTHGIPDEQFIRGEVPMTKQEVRSVSLSKLALGAGDIVYDVGAGTGSVSVEMALQARMGHVYAIERHTDACQLIERNKRKFGTYNLTVVQGMAPQALFDLPTPDAVFIGGSGGSMEQIVAQLTARNPQVRIVINAIAIESIADGVRALEQAGLTAEVTYLSAARSKQAGPYHMMTGLNPVAIITGRREGSL